MPRCDQMKLRGLQACSFPHSSECQGAPTISLKLHKYGSISNIGVVWEISKNSSILVREVVPLQTLSDSLQYHQYYSEQLMHSDNKQIIVKITYHVTERTETEKYSVSIQCILSENYSLSTTLYM